MEKQQLIFITGGARSGKSSFAESYAVELAKKEKRTLYYLATSKKSDDEMVDRIKRHQEDREQSEMHWETVEIPLQIGKNVASFSPNSVVLLDCLTILLSNELFHNGFYDETSHKEAIQTEIMESIMEGIEALASQVKVLIVVSNEVVFDPVEKESALVQTYRKLLGKLHQQIVKQSTEAYMVESAIPLMMKGSNPCAES